MTQAVILDPGGTTGCFRVVIEDARVVYTETWQESYSPSDLWAMLQSLCPSHLVAEGFEYRNKARPGLVLQSRNLLGVCELWTDEHNCYYRTQSAAEGQAFYTDEKLRSFGYYAVGKDHARDATRHGLYWLTFKGGSQLWNVDLKALPKLVGA